MAVNGYRFAVYNSLGAISHYLNAPERHLSIESWTKDPNGNCLELRFRAFARDLNLGDLQILKLQTNVLGVAIDRFAGRLVLNGNPESYDLSEFKLVGLKDVAQQQPCPIDFVDEDDLTDQAGLVLGFSNLETALDIVNSSVYFAPTSFTGNGFAPNREDVGTLVEALAKAVSDLEYTWGVDGSRHPFFRPASGTIVLTSNDILDVEYREADGDGIVTKVEVSFGLVSNKGRLISQQDHVRDERYAYKTYALGGSYPDVGTTKRTSLPLEMALFDRLDGVTVRSYFNVNYVGGDGPAHDGSLATKLTLNSNPADGVTIDGIPAERLFYIRLSTTQAIDGFFLQMTAGVPWCYSVIANNRSAISPSHSEFPSSNLPWTYDQGFFWTPMPAAPLGQTNQVAIMIDMRPKVDTGAASAIQSKLDLFEFHFIRAGEQVKKAAETLYSLPKEIPSRIKVKNLIEPAKLVTFPLRAGGTSTLKAASFEYAITAENFGVTWINLEQELHAEVAAQVEMLKVQAQQTKIGAVEAIRQDLGFRGRAFGSPQIQVDVSTTQGHLIQDEGISLAQRSKLNFVGPGVIASDESGNDRTVVTIPGGGGTTGLKFIVDAGGTDVDPGDGQIRWNHANQSLATRLFIDDLTADGLSLDTFFGHMPNAGYLYLEQIGTPTKQQIWKWTAMPGDAVGYWKFDALRLAYGSAFDDGVQVTAWFFPMGITGGTGIGGGEETGWEQITNVLWVLNKAGVNYAPWTQAYGPTNFQVANGTNGSTGHTWRINNQPQTNSLRVRMKMKWTGNAAFTPEIGFTIGARDTYHGWGVIVDPNRIVFMQDTIERTFFNFNTASDQEFWVDIATNGTTLYAKAYLAGDSPPVGWMHQQNLVPNLVAGHIGVMWRSPFTLLGEWLVIEKKVYP